MFISVMLGILYAFLAVFTFVLSNAIYRKTEHEASPEFINYFRTLIGTITFFGIALIFGILPSIFLLSWDIWLILIISFVFGQVLGDTAYFTAQKHLGTTKALAVSMTFPLFTFILSLIFLNKPFELELLIALILIGIGIIIMGKFKVQPKNSETELEKTQNTLEESNHSEVNQFIYIFFGLLASLGWAIGIVLVEYAFTEISSIIQSENLTSIVGNVIRFPFALLLLLGMIFRQDYKNKKKGSSVKLKRSKSTWVWMTIASIIGTSLGAFLYTEATRIAGSTTMSLIASACPLFALPLTYAINREGISKFGFIGVLLTILGVVIVII